MRAQEGLSDMAQSSLTNIESDADDLLVGKELQAIPIGQVVCVSALVISAEGATDRRGKPYLMLSLRGVDGVVIPARWWDYRQPAEERPRVGYVYRCRATIESYRDERQLNMLAMTPAPDIPLAHFAGATRRSLAELDGTLAELIASLRPELATLVNGVLAGEIAGRYREWPAAQRKHGAVRHGLLAHSVRVAAIAQSLIEAYDLDGLPCDRDLVIAAALLHDVGKVHTLPAVASAELPERARHLDHITLGVLMVRAAAQQTIPRLSAESLETLLHVILAHHGQLTWGSPVEPQTVEAWLVHLADYAESRLWGWSTEEADNAPEPV